MATVYSSEVAVGSYNRIRIKCDYSGTSATLTVQFRRTSAWTDTWRDDVATLEFNGQTKAAAYNYSGTVPASSDWSNPISLVSVSGYTISTSGGTYNWKFNNPLEQSVLGCQGDITIPAQTTPPTGLAVSNVVAGEDSVTAEVSVTGWGTGGTSADRRKELSICTSASTTQRKKTMVYEDTLSTVLTVDNSSTFTDGAAFTITPNTQYYLTMWANNGAQGTGNSSFIPYVTLAAVATVSVGSVTGTTATISYSTSADGGALSKEIQYSLDGGTNWVTGATVSTGSASSGTFTISGLSGYTTYSVETRVHTTAGDSVGATLSVTTDTIAPDTPTVSVATNNTYNSLNVSWGTASFGAPNTGEVSIYSGTSASPTQLQYTKTTTGTSLWTNTGLAANTKYYYRARAKNSANVWSSYSSDSSAVTRAKPATVSLGSTTTTSATISYSFDADGGEYDKDLEYSLDGTNWTLATTITGGSASSGAFTISGLTQNTAYTVRTRVTTTVGSSNGSSVSVTTQPIAKLYGSVNGQAKRIQKMYGSVNGQAKKIVKIYGSVNGSAKLIYEDNS